jgi:hypothetical protein
MKTIVGLCIMMVLTGCAVEHCQLNPQVSMEEKSNSQSNSATDKREETNPKSILKDLQTRVQPGGQFSCKF